jgi:beta-ureidopropionase / N-carbamoyl-L-amino-acid hydrolase
VQVWFEIRHAAQQVCDRIADRFLQQLHVFCAPLGIGIVVAVDESRKALSFDEAGLALVHGVAKDLGFSSMILQTIAGHDALAIQKRLPASLIFVPSERGLSHNPREYTDPVSLEAGLAVLTETLWRMVAAA